MKRALGLVAVLLLGLWGGTAAAQQPISGTVRDSVTSEPLDDAVVSVRGTRFSTTTLANGTFVLTGVPSGEVTLVVRAIGYRSRELRVGAARPAVEVVLARDVFRLEAIVVTG
ncbi:MAG: carboxypeptidase-like regulatory domain-containing protein, partial [Gemmatimonadetes bacterium]|nr:carboxypeptidase-like regulatory domain-containing protein [Gemmatimonadota bacterium]